MGAAEILPAGPAGAVEVSTTDAASRLAREDVEIRAVEGCRWVGCERPAERLPSGPTESVPAVDHEARIASEGEHEDRPQTRDHLGIRRQRSSDVVPTGPCAVHESTVRDRA